MGFTVIFKYKIGDKVVKSSKNIKTGTIDSLCLTEIGNSYHLHDENSLDGYCAVGWITETDINEVQ